MKTLLKGLLGATNRLSLLSFPSSGAHRYTQLRPKVVIQVGMPTFPRAAWERSQGALRRELRTASCVYGTLRVRHSVPTQRVGTRSSDGVPQTLVYNDERSCVGMQYLTLQRRLELR